tara:strand:- start:53 stop:460 length:408 start_codon:yes stop_codon:yes gene_type:complete
MKKYLLLMLLTPLAYAEVQEFYCASHNTDFLTLKISTDPKNPLFLIEDAFSNINNKNYNQENIDVKRLRVTVFDDEDRRLFLFNRVTGVLVTSYERDDDREGRGDYQRYKGRMLNNIDMPRYTWSYDCIKNTVKF